MRSLAKKGETMGEEPLCLFLRDGSRVHFWDGKLFISQKQLDEKLILIREEESEEGDYEISGTQSQKEAT
jgi:hypothetical protein